MSQMKDPRPDQHPNDGVPGKYPNPGESKPQPGPSGLGTDTKNDPANEPAA